MGDGGNAYAAQVAIQGLGQLGEGLRRMKTRKADKKLGEAYMADNPDQQGQFIGDSLRQGQLTPAQAIQLQNQTTNIGPQQQVLSLIKQASETQDPNKRAILMHTVTLMTGAMESFKKKGSGKGGAGAASGSEGDNWPGDTALGKGMSAENIRLLRRQRSIDKKALMDKGWDEQTATQKAMSMYSENVSKVTAKTMENADPAGFTKAPQSDRLIQNIYNPTYPAPPNVPPQNAPANTAPQPPSDLRQPAAPSAFDSIMGN